MDHLVPGISSRWAPATYKVTRSYKGDDFALFPQRAGWEVTERPRRTEGSPHTDQDFEGFIQSWLFFGLLKVALGDDPEFNESEFITQKGFGQWITTEKLQKYLEDWKSRVLEEPQKHLGNLIKTQLALDESRERVLKYCSVGSFTDSPLWKVDQTTILAIMVLGETLSDYKEKIMREASFKMVGWHEHASQGWGDSQLVLQNMVAAGFCQRKLHILQQIFQGHTSSLLLADHVLMPQTKRGQDHSHRDCTGSKCQLENKQSYAVKHVKGGCKCQLLGPDLKRLVDVINLGKIPLLKYLQDPPRVEVITYEPKMQYVIVSHVWADGLGNEKANELPKCQLERFSALFEDINESKRLGRHMSPRNKTRPSIPFWIDTLAIPVERKYTKYRKKAIQEMHRIYLKAEFTLVLDGGLMNENMCGDPQAIAMKIATCGWMRRLWTLQEAVLSHNIYFNFSDTYLSLVDVEAAIKSSVDFHFARTYYHQELLGRKTSTEPQEPDRIFVANVWRAVQWRTTAKPRHSVLALAILLNVKTTRFSGEELEQKRNQLQELEAQMEELLRLLDQVQPCAIPPGMIFLPGPKLSRKGFRWAPKTWLSEIKVDYPDPLSISTAGCSLKDRGLQVQYPGFLLHVLDDDRARIKGMQDFWFVSDKSLQDWYLVKKVNEENGAQDYPWSGTESFAIITQRPPSSVQEIALFVILDEEVSEILYVRMVKRVWIRRESALGTLSGLKKEFRVAKGCCGVVMAPDQWWCVDGLGLSSAVCDSDGDVKSEASSFLSRLNLSSIFLQTRSG